jgi:quercetin dioxygenase-like cupin family protein
LRPDDDVGGDPACWAHLFEEDSGSAPLVTRADLPAVARDAETRGAVWASHSDDLNVNLIVFSAGEGVPDHVNTELDVLIVGVSGHGLVNINGETYALVVGIAVIVPKGTVRSTHALSERFSYLTCHRRRPGLLPTLVGPHL